MRMSLPSSSRRRPRLRLGRVTARSLRRSMDRSLHQKLDAHRQARSAPVHQTDDAAVLVDDLLGDGQAQAGAAGLPGAGLVHPVKALENAGAVLSGDADAVVRDLHPQPLAAAPGADVDAPAVGGVFDGVGHHIHHHLHDPLPVRHDLGQVFFHVQRDGVAVALGLHAHGVVDLGHALAEGEADQIQRTVSRVEAGQGQQVLDDVGHPIALAEDDLQEILLHLGRDGARAVHLHSLIYLTETLQKLNN